MKKKLFTLFTYANLGVMAINSLYFVIPPEYQAMIPNYNWLTAIVAGGATGIIGMLSLYAKSYLQKEGNKNIEIVGKIIDKVVSLEEELIKVKTSNAEVIREVKNLDGGSNKTNLNIERLTNEIAKNNRLQVADLESKMTNPLIDKEALSKIKELLANEEEIKQDNL